jgi:purine-binding chemotaxis protein CheW
MPTPSIAPSAATTARPRGGKYLTFVLAGEEYGVEILKVHEIIGMLPITRVPRAPDCIRGVINLRGKIIPIMDLRSRFGMRTDDVTETCIVVVQAHGTQIGVVVDRMSEVSDIGDEQIEDVPSFGADVNTEFLLGIAKCQGRVRLLLDIERVLSHEGIAAAEAVTAASGGPTD